MTIEERVIPNFWDRVRGKEAVVTPLFPGARRPLNNYVVGVVTYPSDFAHMPIYQPREIEVIDDDTIVVRELDLLDKERKISLSEGQINKANLISGGALPGTSRVIYEWRPTEAIPPTE